MEHRQQRMPKTLNVSVITTLSYIDECIGLCVDVSRA